MSRNDNKNLITLLKLFKNRPYHLSKYLLDNQALNQDFLDKLRKSDKLNQLQNSDFESQYFFNISQMEDFYNSLLEEVSNMSKTKSTKEITEELNKKLNVLIIQEKFEEAAQLRDYMLKIGIKRKNN
jgi:excinuclease UvrABC helicase subunit UvrB